MILQARPCKHSTWRPRQPVIDSESRHYLPDLLAAYEAGCWSASTVIRGCRSSQSPGVLGVLMEGLAEDPSAGY